MISTIMKVREDAAEEVVVGDEGLTTKTPNMSTSTTKSIHVIHTVMNTIMSMTITTTTDIAMSKDMNMVTDTAVVGMTITDMTITGRKATDMMRISRVSSKS